MDCLIDEVMKHDVTKASRDKVLLVIEDYLEECTEYWVDGVQAGYALIFNFNGIRSFDGYKMIKGYTLAAYRIAKAMVDKHPDVMLAFTANNHSVRRLGEMLGFKETLRMGNKIKMERSYESAQ